MDEGMVECYGNVEVEVSHFLLTGNKSINSSDSAGINRGEKPGYKERLDELNAFSDELTKFAQKEGIAIVVAHGMVNREMVKILKKRGWNYCENGKDGYGNLSVNCMEDF